jgi:hypothetical protein
MAGAFLAGAWLRRSQHLARCQPEVSPTTLMHQLVGLKQVASAQDGLDFQRIRRRPCDVGSCPRTLARPAGSHAGQARLAADVQGAPDRRDRIPVVAGKSESPVLIPGAITGRETASPDSVAAGGLAVRMPGLPDRRA